MGALITEKLNGGSLSAAERAKRTLDDLRGRGLMQTPEPEFLAAVQDRRQKRMAQIDAMPADLRALVHDYGFHVVNTLRGAGVTKARIIRHIVETVLDEFSPTRGSFSAQGVRGTGDKGRAGDA